MLVPELDRFFDTIGVTLTKQLEALGSLQLLRVHGLSHYTQLLAARGISHYATPCASGAARSATFFCWFRIDNFNNVYAATANSVIVGVSTEASIAASIAFSIFSTRSS